MKRRKGFTLIEMVCAMAIAGIVIVVIGNVTVNALHWGRWGLQERVIAEQFEQALDLIEEDVRMATDIEVSHWAQNGMLDKVTKTTDLRLWMVDSSNERRRARVIYSMGMTTSDTAGDVPAERPYPNMTLYREQFDEKHRGNKQPVVYYLNTKWDTPKGLEVTYYNKAAVACALSEDIYSVQIKLSGQTKDGTLVSRERRIPLTVKYD